MQRLWPLLNLVITMHVITFITLSCKREDTVTRFEQGSIEFSISGLSALKSLSAVPLKFAIITIQNDQGGLICNKRLIDLYHMNGYYVSSPISLKIGTYKLTEFMLADSLNNVIYASPLLASEKAYLVPKPLPIGFVITKDNVEKITPEVVSCENSKPSDFGYSNFNLNLISTFKLFTAAFIYDSVTKNFVMTDASMKISAGTKVINTFNITPKTEILQMPVLSEKYLIEVTKPGCKPSSKLMTYAELSIFNGSSDSTVLKIILPPQNLNIPGLIAWYTFDGKTDDYFNKYNPVNGSVSSYNTDRYNKSLMCAEFNGLSNYLELPPAFDILNRTYSVWVKIYDVSQMRTIFYLDNPNLKYGLATLNLFSDPPQFQMQAYNVGYYTQLPPLNTWLHMVITVDGSNLKYYFNGIKVSEGIQTTNFLSVNGRPGLIIGSSRNADGRFYKGLMDDFQIYNRALTQDEITLLNLY